MQIINQNISAIKNLCVKYKVKELYAFGSVTNPKKFNDNSDIDLLVEFGAVNEKDYADNYFQFINSLEALLGREVDLITAKYLRNRFFVQSINETKKMIYLS